MKRIVAFIRTTLLGGLFAVLPVMVVCGAVAKTVLATRGAAQSVMEKVTGEGSAAAQFPMIAAVLLVVALSFTVGLAMTSALGRKAEGRFSRALLSKVPGFATLRALAGGFTNAAGEDAVKPALLTFSDGAECFVFVIEDHGDGRFTVFIPNSPNPASGSIRIVRKDLLRLLDARIADVVRVLQHWGTGSAKVLAKHAAAQPLPAP